MCILAHFSSNAYLFCSYNFKNGSILVGYLSVLFLPLHLKLGFGHFCKGLVLYFMHVLCVKIG
jgi:hypothetical protein